MPAIGRAQQKITATIANGASNSGVIGVGGMAWGSFLIPAEFDGTTVSYQVSDDNGTTWSALLDKDNVAVGSTTVSTGNVYNIPSSAFNAESLRLVAGTAQTGATSITVLTKG